MARQDVLKYIGMKPKVKEWILKLRGTSMIKVRYIGEYSSPLQLIKGKIYECLGQEYECYRVIDETDEDYLYPISVFEIVE